MIRRLTLLAVAVALLLTIALPVRSEADAVVPINFTRATLSGAGFNTVAPTALAFGPDGRLYVADNSGRIQALTLNPTTHAVTAVEEVSTATDLLEVYGIAFDPTDASSPPPVFVTNTISGFGDAGQAPPGSFPGRVTKISGAGYTSINDVITGLPVGNSGHQANALEFGPDGRLYIAQGSTTNAGVVNPQAGLFQREEVPTSAALLVADIHEAGFDGDLTYSPANEYSTNVVLTGGDDVEIFAYGLRNPYDIIFHSNGKLYNTDNGPNAGYGPSSTSCTTDNGGDASAPDELNIIVEGAYYGHPNRNRGLAGAPRECVYHAGTAPSTAEHTAPIGLLPPSSNGIAEYTSNKFEGQMQGDLLYVSWVENTLRRVRLGPGGSSVVEDLVMASAFGNPLDMVAAPDGTLYVAEWGANKITYLAPDETPATNVTVTGVAPGAGPTTGGQSVTISGTNFTTTADAIVTIGGAPVTNMTVHNSGMITAVTPAGTAGAQNVVVSNSVGTGTMTGGYTYAIGGGTQPPTANAGPDWSGPIGHNDHAHVTLDATASLDTDGFIETYEWFEGQALLSTNMTDSLQFTLGEHLVTLRVTDNDGYVDTDDVRIIVTLTAENPEPYWCFDVDGDLDVDQNDVNIVGAGFGSRFTNTGYTAGYARMRDFNIDRVVNSGDLLGTRSSFAGACPLTDQEIRAATVWMEQYQNVNEAIADGFIQVTQWIPGQGRHMIKGSSVATALTDQDTVFIAGEPESLLYSPDNTIPGGWRLSGGMWIMPVNTVPQVPQGFTGNEDAWHYHNGLCLNSAGFALAENVTEAQCYGGGGNIWLERAGWLVHLWNFNPNPVGRFVEINDAMTNGPTTGAASIAIDANPGAAGVQNARAVAGSSFTVDVVASNLADIAAFNFDLEYDPAIFTGPTIGSGSSLDRNPNANQAFLESTGRAFVCTPPDAAGGLTSGTKKVARISCFSTGSGAGANATSAAAVASVTLNVIGVPGSGSALTLKNVNAFNHDNKETASCAPTVSITASCAGASITSATGGDTDSDGTPDSIDNCPATPNPSQADGDADWLGDACEASVYGTNPANPDSDADGCRDGKEALVLQFAPGQGGDRNPAYYWDFFDVTSDRAIDLSDTLSVLAYFGDPGISPAGNARDRSAPDMLKPWRTAEDNDGVDLRDALANLQSFGNLCN